MRTKFIAGLWLATAAISLAGCGGAKQPGDGKGIEVPITSIDPNTVTWGDIPAKRTDGQPFNPKYDVLVFINFTDDGYQGRIHYFNATGSDMPSMQKRMNTAIGFLSDPANIDKIPPESLNNPAIRRDFENFTFSAQSNVLLYVKNPNRKFRAIPLFFTKMLDDGVTTATKNKAFYDPEAVDITLPDGSVITGRAVYLRNYFTKGSGTGPGTKPVKNPEKLSYAFNFNFDMRSADDPNTYSQDVFDPDGNNGCLECPPP